MEFNNNKSIFLQIADTINEKVVKGVYPAGEKIPSVRELAEELGVNPNTIMRTYNELQSANIIDNKRGIGYFVNPDAQKLILERKRSDTLDLHLDQSEARIRAKINKLKGAMINNSILSAKDVSDFEFRKDSTSRMQ